MTNAQEQRLETLETEVSFQGDTLQSLNAALVEQQRQLSELHREMRLMREALASLRRQVGSGPDAPDEPPPPHY